MITGYLNARFVLFPLIGGYECYISGLIIHPDSRGRSAGNRLLEKLNCIAEEYGAVRMMLNNQRDSESCRRDFYKKQGFRERNSFSNFVKILTADKALNNKTEIPLLIPLLSGCSVLI